MKHLITGSLILCFLMMTAITSYAQEQDTLKQDTLKAKKMEGHTWHQVVMVKFKPGTMDKAHKMIHEHFEKAGMDAELEGPQIIQFHTGEWDMMFVWTMDSINEMDWEITPDDEKWWAQMAEQEGGMDKAMEVMQQYLDMVQNSTSYLATSQQQAETEQKTMGNNN